MTHILPSLNAVVVGCYSRLLSCFLCIQYFQWILHCLQHNNAMLNTIFALVFFFCKVFQCSSDFCTARKFSGALTKIIYPVQKSGHLNLQMQCMCCYWMITCNFQALNQVLLFRCFKFCVVAFVRWKFHISYAHKLNEL